MTRGFLQAHVGRLVVIGAAALTLVAAAAPNGTASSAQCQPTRAIFYSSDDWLALAQALGADASSCAQYYISIPPPAANKLQMRLNAANVVDALGPNFHAVGEVSYTAWSNWVASTGNSWYAAGQAARATMDAAGFNVAAGDTWAVNEFPSTVLSNAPGARANAEQLVQGLYAGQGTDVPAKGIVFMIGVGQNGVSLPGYTASLESWFQDSTFWSTMSADVSDFEFETYGDVRNYAVSGEDPPTRITYLNDFLQAPLALVSAPNAPATAADARSFLGSAYGPLANADWAWMSSYGWTEVSSSVMADYVSAQTYAMRTYGGGARLGFAFNPQNSEGLTTSDYKTDLSGILQRLAGSIHETDGGDPSQACEATGCSAVLAGAAPVPGWQSFSSWIQTVASFTSLPQTLTPGTASGPVTVQLQTAGVATNLPIPDTVTLSSSSPTGMFSLAPGGPWTPTLTMTVPPGSENASFYMQDSAPGSPTLTANLNGQLTTQVETVSAPASATPPPPPPPPAANVESLTYTPERNRMHVDLRIVGQSGQPVQAKVSLDLLVGGSRVATNLGTTTAQGAFGFTAFQALQRGCYSVQVTSVVASGYQWNGTSPTQTDCITTLPAHVGSLVFAPRGGRMHIAARVTNASGQPIVAHVGLAVLVGSSTVATTVAASTAEGAVGVTAAPALQRGCYGIRIQSVASPGYTWDGASPTQTYCVTTLPAHVSLVSFARRSTVHRTTVQVHVKGRKGHEGHVRVETRLHAVPHLHVELAVADDSGRPLRAHVSFTLLWGSTTFAATGGQTGTDGRIGVTAGATLASGCYRVQITSVSARGYVWDDVTPPQRYCVP